MRMQLPSGRQVQITIIYRPIVRPKKKGVYRTTTVLVKDQGKQSPFLSGTTSCSPKDQFVRLTGRQLACTRALKDSGLSESDQEALFGKICAGKSRTEFDPATV